MTSAQTLSKRIEDSDALVGIIGLGYVGLPLAYAMHKGGMRVLGFDVDRTKVEMLGEGRSYLTHPSNDLVAQMVEADHLEATDDFSRLAEPDVIIVCVPTPLGPHGEPDLSYVERAGSQIGATLRRGQLVVLESTTYPGTTREEFLGAIRQTCPAGLESGVDFFVAYSPEREDPGRVDYSTGTIPKIVGGLDEASTRLAAELYTKGVEQVVPVRSAEVAEAAKLLENIFRCVNIALVNEMKMVLDRMNIDVWEVINAAKTKPFGFMPFYPGPGLGGHCIPIDPFYLSWKAKEVGTPTRFIELAGEINTRMPGYVVRRLADGLNRVGKPVKDARVLVLGLAYKPDVSDTRESPSFELIAELRELGARVDYSDPFVPQTVPVRRHDLQMVSVALSPETVASYDVVLIATDHASFDYDLIAEHAGLIVDTRNAMSRARSEVRGTLVRA